MKEFNINKEIKALTKPIYTKQFFNIGHWELLYPEDVKQVKVDLDIPTTTHIPELTIWETIQEKLHNG